MGGALTRRLKNYKIFFAKIAKSRIWMFWRDLELRISGNESRRSNREEEMNNEVLEVCVGALRVIPAETRLTVYRRRPVLGRSRASFSTSFFQGVAFCCAQKCKIDASLDYRKVQVLQIIVQFPVNFSMKRLIEGDFQKWNLLIQGGSLNQKLQKWVFAKFFRKIDGKSNGMSSNRASREKVWLLKLHFE